MRAAYRYSRWDGSQQIEPFTADELMEHLADGLLNNRDLWSAMREMMQRGANLPSGRRVSGMRDILERLRERRQEQLDRYNLGSIMEDIRARLDQVLESERQGIKRRLDEPAQPQAEQSPTAGS